MNVTAYRTDKIQPGHKLVGVLDAHLPKLLEKDIVVATSKIVSICEGSVVANDGTVDKHDLIRRQAQYYMEEECLADYGIILTIKNDTLIASSGIDESNGNGYFILWPRRPHHTAAGVWKHLRTKYNLKELGVIITDSHTTPMRWGVTGIGIAWCGFEPLKNYIGTPDIFGRNLHVTQASTLDGLAAAACVVMGEGDEQTPLAVISDAPAVFTSRPPTARDIAALGISKEKDIFSPLINSPKWQKGGQP